MKNTISTSEIFVKKIQEKGQKLITKDEILILWTRSGGSKTRESYAVSLLLGREVLSRVARDVYIRSGENPDELYWDIVKKLIQIHAPSGAIVGGEKALELHMMNYSIPPVLILYTRHRSVRVRLSDGREVHFRTMISGEKTKKKNLFPFFLQQSVICVPIREISIPIAELALLEAFSLREYQIGIAENTILKFLKSSHEKLDGKIFDSIVKYRYIRAVNRLRVFAKNEGYEYLYQATLSAIKKEGGGCFINI